MDLINRESLQIRITGIVQGVGFRPFVYKLAVSVGLNGEVFNENSDVLIILQGNEEKLEEFMDKLIKNAPPLSKIITVTKSIIEYKRLESFEIVESRGDRKELVYISPDTGTCADCEREILDENNRRFMHPFTNCTNCGPRFTIIKGVPYDRPLTTMAEFTMCDECKSEYTDSLDRRYHAQPTCCPVCGPDLFLINSTDKTIFYTNVKNDNSYILGKIINAEINKEKLYARNFKEIIELAIDIINKGKILAVKGIGGYHLTCDALNNEAVKNLRKRKLRDDKPFAVMMRDIETVKYYCEVSEVEEKLLISEKKPIVLLKKKPICDVELSGDICGENPYIGVMLPYTPLHLLLFKGKSNLSVIVATSGNISSEPIAFLDEEAYQKLQSICDYFLINNRDIFIRTDDSVTRVYNEKEYPIRRARGYAPAPLDVSVVNSSTKVLALGGELKSTFCLSRGNEFYLSHHIGDLENEETLRSFEEGIVHYKKLFQVEPEILAYDLHPEYLSTKYALAQDFQYKYGIQHHHAHIVSCMADNMLDGEVIGVAFDGTGYGLDGNIWGGEFFVGGYTGFARRAHFDYVKLPGGEKAVKEPWRMAVSYLKAVSRISDDYFLDRAVKYGTNTNEMTFLLKMLEKGINSPLTSSAGRLFDAVSAVLGIRTRINYEGQAAIELEHKADISYSKTFKYDFEDSMNEKGVYIIKHQQMLMDIINEKEDGASTAELSGRFHHTMAKIITDMCIKLKKETGLKRVVLGGGVFQNITLLSLTINELKKNGLEPFIHHRVPANDGGISFGQAMMANFLYGKK